MKLNKRIVIISSVSYLLLFLNPAHSEVGQLEKQLESLNIPDDKIDPIISEDQFFIVNTRYSSLINRHELSLQGGNNFTTEGHLSTQTTALSYRYHINSKFSTGARYTKYSNSLTSSGKKLFRDGTVLPDTDFAKNSKELFLNYNTIYGKVRWSEDTVVYFDQYISLGGGKMELASGPTTHGFLDLGLSFWLGKHMSSRIGFKNELYKQTTVLKNEHTIHNAIGYFEIGYLFGSGKTGLL